MESLPRGEVGAGIGPILEQMQAGYFDLASERLASRTAREIGNLDEFREWFAADEENAAASGFVRAPWSEAAESASILEELKVSVRCIPFDQQLAPGSACVLTGRPAVVEAVFGKAY
jgi:prolyl-tRNA synthetase